MARKKAKTVKRTAPVRRKSRSGSSSIGFAIAGAVFSLIAYVVFGGEFSLDDITPHQPSPVAAPGGDKHVGADRLVGQASVIDADTLEVHGQRIRFNGIDAPEGGQRCLDAKGVLVRCGQIAANALDRFIAGNPVTCTISGKDRYNRALGGCSVRNVDLQDWLVRNGHALAYRQYSKDYISAEDEARRTKAGMWAGEFVEPWNWRKGARLPVEGATKANFAP